MINSTKFVVCLNPRVLSLLDLYQKWCLFLQLAAQKKTAIFGAAQTHIWPFLFCQSFSRSLETEWVNITLLSNIHIGPPNLVLMHSKIIPCSSVSNSCDGTLNAIMHVICIALFYPQRDHRILVLHNRKTIILKCITANILTAKNTTFCGVMISHVLPLPFWHFITVPSTADKWSCSCIFGNISYIIQSVGSTVNQCTSISKNTSFRGVMISPAHICIDVVIQLLVPTKIANAALCKL